MERQELKSKSIAWVAYEGDDNTLDLQFREGGVYRYFMVTEDVFRGLLGADSAGRFFHQHIRGRFPYRRLDT